MLSLLILAGSLSVSDVLRDFRGGAPIELTESRMRDLAKVGALSMNELDAELTLDAEPQHAWPELRALQCREAQRSSIIICHDEQNDRYVVLSSQ